jgi:hypothetical protein
MVTQVGSSVAVHFILVHLVTYKCYSVTFQNRPCVTDRTFCTSVGPDWQKYVTFVRQTKNLHDAPYGLLYDFLKHHEPEVEKDRALRGG